MSDTWKRSVRFPVDLVARIEGAALGREKFSATVIRLVEEALETPPSAGQARRYAEAAAGRRSAPVAAKRPAPPPIVVAPAARRWRGPDPKPGR